MPTVTLNKQVFEKLVGKKLPLDKLKDRISMLGTDLEKIEGNEIVVEVFPNRPDMLSEQGFARAFSSFIGVKKGLRKYKVEKSDAKIIVEKSVKDIRPCSAAAIVKGVKFTDELIKEIMQNQEKLHKTFGRDRRKVALGYYVLDKVNFPVTYMAKKPREIKFQPLHFPSELDGLQVLSQHPTGREFGYQLEGLKQFPVYYDSDGKVLSLPPIINSNEAGSVLPGTSDVLVECSGFDQRTLNLAINMAVANLADMGGKVFSVEIVYPDKKVVTPNFDPIEWDISLDFINKMLGLNLKDSDIKELLSRMGHDYKNGKVSVPSYRADIMHQVDFVEDIAIAYGYENFKPEIPNVSTIGEEDKFEIFKRYVSEILVGYNLLECETYHITNIDNLNRKMNSEMGCVSLTNALNVDYSVLRSWILPSLMQIYQENKHYEYPQNIFTIGTAFKPNSKFETSVEEFTRVAVALCGIEADYTKIRQVFDYLLSSLGLEGDFKSEDNSSFIPGRCARVSVDGVGIAYVGEIAPGVLNNWELEMPVAAFELNLTELFEIINKKK